MVCGAQGGVKPGKAGEEMRVEKNEWKKGISEGLVRRGKARCEKTKSAAGYRGVARDKTGFETSLR